MSRFFDSALLLEPSSKGKAHFFVIRITQQHGTERLFVVHWCRSH